MVPQGFRITGKDQEWFLKITGHPESLRNGSSGLPEHKNKSLDNAFLELKPGQNKVDISCQTLNFSIL
jgi:hypothetical protein